ncbi:MAG: response regulator [Phycisphaerae bacterium]
MTKRILIADDEAHILHVVSMKLSNAGYEVITAMDGQEVLELCAEDRPDLLILDYQMPLLSGTEACAQLRRMEHMRDVPAIMLTARGFEIDRAEMAEARISVELAKPFSPRELLETVNKLLKTCEQEAEAEA